MSVLIPDELDNVLFNEDCLKTSKRMSDATIDLIYADPPFFTGRLYSMNGCCFDDNWTDMEEYTEWIKPRLNEFKRILKSSGSIYIHCDWHISHYLKVLSDNIFGRNNFLNEIIWKRQSSHSDAKQGSKHYGRIHDSILIYTGSQKYVWNQQYTPYDETYIKSAYRHIEPDTGRRYALGDLTGPGGKTKGNPMYEFLGVKRYWRYSRSKMLELLSLGRIEHKNGTVPLIKRYLNEMYGKPVQDIWTDITPDFQRKRFPTQKPEGLLGRIVGTSSNRAQLVYEPFAGSATGAVICNKIGRKWIGSEISDEACKFAIERLNITGCKLRLYSEPKTSIESQSVSIPLDNEKEAIRCQ